MQLLGREIESTDAILQSYSPSANWLDYITIKDEDDVSFAEDLICDHPLDYRIVTRSKLNLSLWDVYLNGVWRHNLQRNEVFPGQPEPPTLPESSYPNAIMEMVRQHIGLESWDTSKDVMINEMSHDEILRHCLEQEGIIGYDITIKMWVMSIYGVALE